MHSPIGTDPPLSGTLRSAKRTALERKGVHSWHPYYAGYSEQFVESALEYLSCSADTLIFDPWSGSGTTSIVASRRGIPSIGLDINPVMATFTAAKSPKTLESTDRIKAFFSKLPKKINPDLPTDPQDALLNIFSTKTTRIARQIWEAAREIPNGSSNFSIFSGDIRTNNGPIDPTQAFIAAVFFVTLRMLGTSKKLTNPTWSRLEHEQIDIPQATLLCALSDTTARMLKDLESFYGDALSRSRDFFSVLGNSCAMKIPSDSIDRVITSPPYLTRIDYAISTAPELYAFGYEGLLRAIRHSTTGAPVITDVPKAQRAEWGSICNRVLDVVKTHPTKASASYYWKNMIQYFSDMESAISEINRVLKVGGSGLIVVQSSYFKDLEIPLGEIIVQLAEAQGMHAYIASREVVKTHMAHVNTRSSKYVTNKVYFEDAVHISK